MSATNYLLKSCDPYWVHSLAERPKPCWYGDSHSKKVVVLWGDSNAASWIPALIPVMKLYHFHLAVFGFIGCDTSFLPETSTQTGFPGEWQLCNEWHTNLPTAVRKLRPVVVIDASTMLGRIGNSAYNASWVKGMVTAFDELTAARRATVRVEIQTLPDRSTYPTRCLSSNPAAVQSCDIDLGTNQAYQAIQTRDKTIATEAHAILIPIWQLFCYEQTCSPIVGKYLTYVDLDHLSTPYSSYLAGSMEQLLVRYNALPVKHRT